jgi:hypothetical protein
MKKAAEEKAGQACIKMLGNHGELEVDKEYEVDVETANRLTGCGIAVLLADPEAVKDAPAVAAGEGN